MTMKTYKIMHKYCGAITRVSGADFYDAMRKSDKDPHYWRVIDIEYEWEC